jgi:hypothetical protein
MPLCQGMNNRIVLILICILSLSSCGLYRQVKLSQAKNKLYTTEIDYHYTFPFKLINNYIIIPVTIQGTNYDFLFDTGAPLCINKELLSSLESESITKISIADYYGNKSSLKTYLIPEIAIENHSWFNTLAYSFDFKEANEASGIDVDGIFGASLMHLAIWEINYNQKLITFTDKLELLKTNTSNTNPINFSEDYTGSPQFKLSIAENEKDIILDTGSPNNISLRKEDFSNINTANMKISVSNKQSLFGEVKDTTYQTNQNVVIGEKLKVESSAVSLNGSIGQNTVGNKFLKNYTVILDWIHEQLYLIEVNNK